MNIDISKVINELIVEIYTSGWLKKQCKIYCKDEDTVEDFQQEVILKLLERQNNKLVEYYLLKENYLGYLHTLIRNEWFDKTSKTYKLLRTTENHVRLDGTNDELLGGCEEC